MKNVQHNLKCHVTISGGNVQVNTSTGPVTQYNKVYKSVGGPSHADMQETAKPVSQVSPSVSDEAAMPECDDPLPALSPLRTGVAPLPEPALSTPPIVAEHSSEPVGAEAQTAVSPEEKAYSEACLRLQTYLPEPEVRRDYMLRLQSCPTAKEMGWIVVDMHSYDPHRITDKVIVTRDFLRMLRTFAPRVTCSPDNIRKYVNEAWAMRNKARSAHCADRTSETLYNKP